VFKLSVHKGVKQRLKDVSMIALTSLMLFGCGSTPKQTVSAANNIIALGSVSQSSNYYLEQAKTAQGITKQAYQLQALRAAQLSHQPQDQPIALDLINQLNVQLMLSDDHKLEWLLLQSQHFSQHQQPQQALAVLAEQSHWQLATQRWLDFYQFKATLQAQQQQVTAALASLATAVPYAKLEQQSLSLSQQIWPLVSSLSPDELNDYTPANPALAGWKNLALITKQSMHSPDTLRQRIGEWTRSNPHHMAAENLPENLVAMLNIQAYQPSKIALLLPLSGRYAKLGQAVQHGIVSNLMAHNTEQQLMSFDTQALGALAAHQLAVEQGAEFIIGPLLKGNVAQINAITSDIPTLFLNKSVNELTTHQFTFSLNREAEAMQAVEYIFNQGKKHPVLVAPNNAQGHRIGRLFNEKWQELNQDDVYAKPVEAFYFGKDKKLEKGKKSKTLKQTIESLFETDQSQARINHTRLLVGTKMKSETRSRRDIDAIYLVANPKQTGMLMPSVEVTVSAFAPQVAVYVGSSGNDNLDAAQDRSHLNRLTVSDMPWLIAQPAQLSPRYIQKLWPEIKQSQMRLFAMGFDAYSLISRLAQMQLFPEFNLEGFSGTLSVGPESDIIRKMTWAQYQRGKLIEQK